MMKTGLPALIHPLSMSQFLSHYQENEPFLVEASAPEINSIKELPFLASLDALLNSWPHVISAHLPDLRDEASAIDTTAKDAGKLYQNGMGLLFNDAETISPLLNSWLMDIRKDLGISALTISRCLIYATPDGKGTAPHFDQNINFVLQLHGTKKWWMAPNREVLNPLSRHTMGLPSDPELASYSESEMPESLPSDAICYELHPGSVLFVPRGYWHATEARGDALAINFTFTAPTWIDLFTAALRSRLALSPAWRETADGVSDEDRLVSAHHKFDYLLSTLIQDLPNWKAQDILEATDPEN
jgi:50S ribosomal protein L16 3-hydroxylase